MTEIHAQLIGDKAVVSRAELEKLVELAGRSAEVKLQMQEEDLPTRAIMELAEQGGAFDWLENEPDLYSQEDLKVRYWEQK